MHIFHPKVCVILILICIGTARRGREAVQAPAQPAPCASAAEHPALPSHAPGAARAPSLLTTSHPTACREHEERTEQGTSDTPTWGFQAPTETEASSPIPVYLQEKIRGTLHLTKHGNILNTNTLALARPVWKPKCRRLYRERYFKGDLPPGQCQKREAAHPAG